MMCASDTFPVVIQEHVTTQSFSLDAQVAFTSYFPHSPFLICCGKVGFSIRQISASDLETEFEESNVQVIWGIS